MSGCRFLAKITEQDFSLAAVPIAIFTSFPNESGIIDEFPRLRLRFSTKTDTFVQLKERIRDFIQFAAGGHAA